LSRPSTRFLDCFNADIGDFFPLHGEHAMGQRSLGETSAKERGG
jgi:hypothetical protein